MEVEVRTLRGDCVQNGFTPSYESNIDSTATYGISVRLHPGKGHICWSPAPTRRPEFSMERDRDQPSYHRDSDSLPDNTSPSALCPSPTLSITSPSPDIFDQLVEHFEKKATIPQYSKEPKLLKKSASHHRSGRRRTVPSSRHSRKPPSQQGRRSWHSSNRTSIPPRRQTSTPDSNVSSLETRTASDILFSRTQTWSSSESGRHSAGSLQAVYCEISSGKTFKTRKSSCSTTDDSVSISSNRSASLLFLNINPRKDTSTLDMLRSVRRSMTPEVAGQYRRDDVDSPNYYINNLLSPASSRNSLDQVTADSISRGRLKRTASNKFNDTIESVSQLSGSTRSLPARSRSTIGHYSRDEERVWNGNVAHNKAHTLGSMYARETRSPISPNLHSDHTDLISNSTDGSSRSASRLSDAPRAVSSLQVKDSYGYEIHARSNSALDVALTEDHDSIMRLIKMREDDFTTKLISAMRELKDIAEVARIIDEVDDEEWLLVFIGELDHRLRYLMKLEEEGEEAEDQEANLREKATILDVALDLISFLKERSAYRDHRRSSNRNGDMLARENSDGTEDGSATIRRMRKIADTAPQNPYDMQKWQRQLMNLAGTLDKYISVLQKEKPHQTPPPSSRNFNSSPRGYVSLGVVTNGPRSVVSPTSSDSSGSRFEPKHSSAKGQFSFKGADKDNERKFRVLQNGYNHNDNNNNNNNNNRSPIILSAQPVSTLPVLDLRKSKSCTPNLSSQETSPTRSFKNNSQQDPKIVPDVSDNSYGFWPKRDKNNRSVDRTTQKYPKNVSDMSDNITGFQPTRDKNNASAGSPNWRRNNDQSCRSKSVENLKKAFERETVSNGPTVNETSKGGFERERYLPNRSMSIFDDDNMLVSSDEKTSFGRSKTPLSCKSWVAGDKSVDTVDTGWSRTAADGAASPLAANAVVSAYCKFPDEKRRRSLSVESDSEKRRALRRQKSEFKMCVGDGETDSSDRAMRRSVSENAPSTVKLPVPRDRTTGPGARPKVRSSATVQPARRRSDASDSKRRGSRSTPTATSSSSTQCDFDQSLRQREKSNEETLKQMKRKADLLKSGLDEARRERDEKDRKIAVLQARLERTKKNLVMGESEKGAVEEEMDRLNKLLKEKTEESEEEMSSLKRRLQELEKKLEKEKQRQTRMNDTIEDLQNQLISAERRYEKMKRNKKDLEQQIEELTVALVRERKSGAHLQQENAKLESELESKEEELAAERSRKDRTGVELRQQNDELKKELERAQDLANSLTDEKVRMKEKMDELESRLDQADCKISDLESRKRNMGGENAVLDQRLLDARQNADTLAKEKCRLQDSLEEVESKMENMNAIIGTLEKDKKDLEAKVDYLTKELKLNEEMKKAQQEQYDKEIQRLLAEKRERKRDELAKAKEEAEHERARADKLEMENEELRRKETRGERACETSSTGVGTEDKSVQAEDMSYTRMRAFDWYSSQAQRDARRLNESGRQLELEMRRKIRAARDAMREVNVTIINTRELYRGPITPQH